jgi:nicotinamidase-related amidase
MKQPIIVGRPVVVVVDMQVGDGGASIPHMEGAEDASPVCRRVVQAARDAGVPVVFLFEIHRATLIDFGRELDGSETVHLVEGTAGAAAEPGLEPRPGDPVVVKRRYSGFFGTDLQIVLNGLGAQTLILIGGLTDVCVHYTFADGHQHDYYVRVVEDAVSGSSRAAHEASLAAMEYLQAGARRSSKEIVDALRGWAASAATGAGADGSAGGRA